jgi:hypothetical protein
LQIVFGAMATLTCTPGGASSAPQDALSVRPLAARTVILVALDGVRWQEVFGGVDPALAERQRLSLDERLDSAHLMPNLSRLMSTDGVAIGAPGVDSPMEASGPNFVSLPGYMEMLTGRTDSACTDNQCGVIGKATVADDVASAVGEAIVVSSWPVIGRAASHESGRVLVSAGRHGDALSRRVLTADAAVAEAVAAGERTRSAVGDADFRRDVETAELALAVLDHRRPSFLFVGLGEPDEYGHQDDYRGYLGALQRADGVIGRIADRVRRANASGHPTTLMVTTDHGRSFEFTTHGREHPESARVWMVATGANVDARGFVASPKVRHLADVGQTVRVLLGLEPSGAEGAGTPLSELRGPGKDVEGVALR